MRQENQKTGKIVQWLGWISVVYTVLKYGYALNDASSDASIRAYAWLIAFEGIFFIGAGLLVVWFGHWIAKPVGAPEPAQPDSREAD